MITLAALETTIITHNLMSALAKSVLWAGADIIQRQEDVSFAKSREYNIPHNMAVLWIKS